MSDIGARRKLLDLERRIRRLEISSGPVEVRPGLVSGTAITTELKVVFVTTLPAIPGRFSIVELQNDTVYWTAGIPAGQPGDDRWHPMGGKFGQTTGLPGEFVGP